MLEELKERLKKKESTICVIGAGYVGLPLLVEFARAGLKSIGFDLNQEKIKQLKDGIDISGELDNDYLKETIEEFKLEFTSNPEIIKDADFVLICVPTPIDKKKKPDLSYLESAGKTTGKNIKRGCVVVLESTVYPGVTEDVLKPIIEKESGMVCGSDFSIGYSPERINPGDSEHNLKNVVNVVSGFNDKTTDVLKDLYSLIIKAGVFKAKSIRVAEAAKVIENIQRDLNIALINELSIIFRNMGIDTKDVLEAAETKWNFHSYRPGLVGGHCIPVDPYYLVFKSKEIGYDPKVILAGREINDSMPQRVADTAIGAIKKSGKNLKDTRVLLLGLTFKKNVKDTRNTPVRDIIKPLKDNGVEIIAYDPLLKKQNIKGFGVEPIDGLVVNNIDCVIIVTDHDVFSRDVTIDKLKGILNPGAVIVDVRRMLDSKEAEKAGFEYISI